MKADLNGILENHMSGAMEILFAGYALLKDWQSTETYAHKLLALFETLKNRDSGNMAKRYCDVNLILTKVYLEFGHLEFSIKTLKEGARFLIKSNIDNFNQLLVVFFDYASSVANACNTKSYYLDALKIYRLTKQTLNDCQKNIKTLSKDDRLTLSSYEQKLESVFQEAKSNYFELLRLINDSSAAKDALEKIQPSLNSGTLTITLKRPNELIYLKSALEKLDILVEKTSNLQLKVDLYVCTPETLKNACELSAEAIKKANAEQEARKVIQARTLNAPLLEKAEMTGTPIFSSPLHAEKLELMKIDNATIDENSSNIIEKKSKKATKSFFSVASSPKSIAEKSTETMISYHWTNARRRYCSDEKNQGEVKMLSGSGTPDNLWFGYIPYSLREHPFYNQWKNKLERQMIDNSSIRYINKELQRLGHQNFSSEHPYKFKIVIPNHDERLYGWIEDTVTDSDGKKHYLVCFGYVGDHKTTYLPNPEKLKKEFNKEDSNSSENKEPENLTM